MGLHDPSRKRHGKVGFIDFATIIGVDRSQFEQMIRNAELAKWGIVVNEPI